MRMLSQSSSHKSTQILVNNMMSKIIKTTPLLKQDNYAQTGMSDNRHGNSMDLLNELVTKLSKDIENANEL